ncbi:MAG: recombinase family protein [Angelakisella sp.]|nr:recombinase family protein [Angelakisella sp.]
MIVIDATEQVEEVQLRVAAYARVSTDSHDQLNSFAAQTRYFSSLIESKENWVLADIYADEGIFGTSAVKRPELLATDRRLSPWPNR